MRGEMASCREVGELWLTRTMFDDGTNSYLTIDRADPEIHIAAELISELKSGRFGPDVQLDHDLLRINARNRDVIYVVEPEGPDGICYAHWPD